MKMIKIINIINCFDNELSFILGSTNPQPINVLVEPFSTSCLKDKIYLSVLLLLPRSVLMNDQFNFTIELQLNHYIQLLLEHIIQILSSKEGNLLLYYKAINFQDITI